MEGFSRACRTKVILFAMFVLTSWDFALVTRRNVVLTLLPLALSVALLLCVTRCDCLATLLLEYYFGLLRTKTNTDQLTVQGLLHLVVQTETFYSLCQKNAFECGPATRLSYHHLKELTHNKAYLDSDVLTEDEFRALYNSTADLALKFMRAADVPVANITPLVQTKITRLAGYHV